MKFDNSKAHAKLVQELQPVNNAVFQALQPLIEEILKHRVREKVFNALKSPGLDLSRTVALNDQFFESQIFSEFGDPDDQTGESHEKLLHLMYDAVGDYKEMVRAETKRSYNANQSLLEEEGWQRRPEPEQL